MVYCSKILGISNMTYEVQPLGKFPMSISLRAILFFHFFMFLHFTNPTF